MIDRRQALGSMGGALLATALPAPVSAAGARKAPRLRVGDTVGLVAPASALTLPWELDRAQHWIRGMGLVPKLGQHVREQNGYLAGTDAQRAEDYMAMVADPDVRGIFAVRGGWGGARILPLLDWDAIRANPKLLIGYSDTTALHLAIAARAGFPTIHGPNAASRWERESWESLWRLAFAADTPMLGGVEVEQASGRAGRTITGGTARGRLLGGNLTILSTLMGTPWLPRFDGAVLFLEDVNEDVYRVDRMLQQLRLAGILGKLSGIVFGQCTRCEPETQEQSGFTLDDILDHHLGALGIPAFTGANTGHVTNQLAMPHGAEVELDADSRTLRLVEPVVA
ncbi:LD-carboxypeptidase [Qipengyuania sp. XHP0211]|uniref:S66 peptidase family protein n=1 Tax=Qipengyuania sp. XHP0211 TaxID=3038079 RepID=UPI00241DC06B|nr:LD-carboxypeptidase [Qipengyuania sp. XHP0211]MDG5751934.1 LD-carboxypeptidase [Qipengyuania sp. XHP0211]